MRSSYVNVLILAVSVIAACGGGTPPPKDENEPVEHASSSKEWTPDNAQSAATPPPASAVDPAQPAASPKPAPGDLVAPTADDPWMAAHQMPAGDVLKTMRAAQGKVNACWRASKKRDPSVSGEVKIKFVITHGGSVRVWRNEDSSVSDEECINCVGEVIKSLQFPTQKSPGDAWGVYQINLGG
jgi:hypothetical protein